MRRVAEILRVLRRDVQPEDPVRIVHIETCRVVPFDAICVVSEHIPRGAVSLRVEPFDSQDAIQAVELLIQGCRSSLLFFLCKTNLNLVTPHLSKVFPSLVAVNLEYAGLWQIEAH